MTDRPARAADELEIRNLIARAAHLADDGDLGEVAALWTEDGVWTSPAEGSRTGAAQIVAGARDRRARGTSGPGSGSRHFVTTVLVTFEDADNAVVESNFLFCR